MKKKISFKELIRKLFVNGTGSGILQPCCPRLSEDYAEKLEIKRKIASLPSNSTFDSKIQNGKFPIELLHLVCSFLTTSERAALSQASTYFYNFIANNEDYWQCKQSLASSSINLSEEWLHHLSPKSLNVFYKMMERDLSTQHARATIKKNYTPAATILRILKLVASLLLLLATITWSLQMDEYIAGFWVALLVGLPLILLGLILGILVCCIATPTLCWSLDTYRDVCISTAGYWTSWLYAFRYNSRAGQIIAVFLCSGIPMLLGFGYLVPYHVLPKTFKIATQTFTPMTMTMAVALLLVMMILIPLTRCFSFRWKHLEYLRYFAIFTIISSLLLCAAAIVRLDFGEAARGYFLWTYVFILAIPPLLFACLSVYMQTLCLDWTLCNDKHSLQCSTKSTLIWFIPSVVIFLLLTMFMVTFCVTFDVTHWDEKRKSRVRYVPVVAGFAPLLVLQTLLVMFYFCKMLKLIPEHSNKFPCTLWKPPLISVSMEKFVV